MIRRQTLAHSSLIVCVFFVVAARTSAQDVGAPQPMGAEADVNCFGYVGPENEAFVGSVVSGDAVYEQSAFSFQDVDAQPGNRGTTTGHRARTVFDIPSGDHRPGSPSTSAAHALCVGPGGDPQITATCTDVP
jgi:hypothetical protein